jgi:hypothetical protein
MNTDITNGSVASNVKATIDSADHVVDCLATDLAKMTLENLSAPVSRLPPELLSLIFLECLPASPKPWDPNSAPLLLMQICGHWRKIALSTALLWRHIHVELNTSSPESQIAWVENWLVRSSGCPLSVLLHSYGANVGHPVFNAIVLHAPQWEDLDIQLPYPLILTLLSAQNNLPMLRRLRIEITYSPSRQFPIDTFLVAPMLRNVCLRVPLELVKLPWAQLTHCTLSLQGNECVEFIRRTPQLVNCTLDDCVDFPEICQDPDQRAVSHLTSLHLTEGGRTMMPFIFNHITLPKLRELSVDLVDSTDWPHPIFMEFLARSSCHLQRLALLSAEISYEDFVILLQNQPSLIELEIDWVDTPYNNGDSPIVDDNLINRLHYWDNLTEYQRPNLLPNLRILKLWGPLPFNDDNFVELVRSRWHSGAAQLVFVGAQYHRDWDTQAIRQLRHFCDEGLELLIEFVPPERRGICPKWGSEASLPHNFPGVILYFIATASAHTDHPS